MCVNKNQICCCVKYTCYSSTQALMLDFIDLKESYICIYKLYAPSYAQNLFLASTDLAAAAFGLLCWKLAHLGMCRSAADSLKRRLQFGHCT